MKEKHNDNVLKIKEFFLNEMDKIIKTMKLYFSEYKYSSYEEIYSKLPDIIAKCDQIDYEECSIAEAYAAFHLLDRFVRFKIMCIELFSNDEIIINKKKV